MIVAATLLAGLLSTGIPGSGSSPARADRGHTEPNMISDGARPFYAYVAKGEYLYVKTDAQTRYITDQAGAQHQWSRQGKAYGPAAADGIWQIYVPGGASEDRGSWQIEARSSSEASSSIDGRVWSHRYYMSQDWQDPEGISLQFWAINDAGYLYDVRLRGYHGVNSNIGANSNGNTRSPDDCTSVYRSKDHTEADNANPCGSWYRLFFSEPAADLPETAQMAGEEVRVRPKLLEQTELEQAGLKYLSSGAPGTFAGTFVSTITPRFEGNYELQIDTNGNGAFGEADDVTVPLPANGSGSYRYEWDGANAQGETVTPSGTRLNARLRFSKMSELHLTQNDVEGRGGLQVTRLNGSGSAEERSTIYWDDRKLSTKDRDTLTPVVDGRAGVDSRGYVHGWDFKQRCIESDESCGAWGNNRSIDDWAYAGIEAVTPALAFGGEAGISLEKTADRDGYREAGEAVSYTFDVTNTGTLDLADVTVSEQEFSGTGELSPIVCPGETLAMGASMRCTAAYRVTQADLERGTIDNVAVASGTPPGSPAVVSEPAAERLRAEDRPGLALEKRVKNVASGAEAWAADTGFELGQQLEYSFSVTNTGNLRLADVRVDETRFTGEGEPVKIDCPETALEPGETMSCSAGYGPIPQSDVDRGTIENTATASGTAARHPKVESGPSSAVAVAPRAPAIALTKLADRGAFVSGEEIRYDFHVANIGNVTLEEVGIDEHGFDGTGELSAVVCAQRTLAPGESTTCAAQYAATQEDLDRGTIANSATAKAQDPDGETVLSPPSGVVIPGTQIPGLELVKSADREVFAVGDTIAYTFLARNSGNVTLTDIAVEETEFTGSGEIEEIVCAADVLVPGQETSCEAHYRATQADMDRGAIDNIAILTGLGPSGDPVSSDPDAANVQADQRIALHLEKLVDHERFAAGDRLGYSFEVTNSGSVTAYDVDVEEVAFNGSGRISEVVCAGEDAPALAPGERLSCTATYTATPEDQGGEVELVNVAVAVGHPGSPDAAAVFSNEDDARSRPDPMPAIGASHDPSAPAALARTGGADLSPVLLSGGGLLVLGGGSALLRGLIRWRRLNALDGARRRGDWTPSSEG